METASSRQGAFRSFFPTPSFLRMDAIGVDISDQSLKYIELEVVHDQFEPKQWGRMKVPEGAIQKGKILDHGKVVSMLKELKEKVKVPFVHASLPEEHAYLFQTEVDKEIKGSELDTAIESNLRENVPLSPEQAVFSYKMIPQNRRSQSTSIFNGEEEKVEENTGKRLASVSVYPKEIVEQYSSAFKEAGFKPLSFEVEAQAIARSVVPRHDDGVHVVLDIGTSKVGLSIIDHGIIVFTSTLEIGGNDFQNAIKKSLNISEKEAEKIKNEQGFIRAKGNEEVFQALFSAMSVLKDEVNKHVTFWHSEHEKDSGKITHICLSGGNANIKGLPEYLEANVGVPTMLANVWTNVLSFDDYIPKIPKNHSLEYATAIGLALRSARK